ncbi:MAG: amidohydrolase family protein [Betaproteobacteria bacterium]|nr:amidohydrolase family protein [Betaproteobacteria bacterium]
MRSGFVFGCALAVAGAGMLAALPAPAQAPLPIFDAHLHYSHDAWENLPPPAAIEVLRKGGIRRALLSSSNDEGQQRLYALAPEIIVPSLRPYRTRGDLGTWVNDSSVIGYLEERLKKYRYAAVGEFHLYGADADLPVPRRMVELAKQHGLILHAHSDVIAVERLFKQWPEARILWAHSGFARADEVRDMLRKHKNLWCDLAFRGDHHSGGKATDEWRAVFTEFPDRFMLGTDTFTPERWLYVGEHANTARTWLSSLPRDVAEKIAYRNAEALLGGFNMAKFGAH